MSRPSLIDLTVAKVPTRPLCQLHDMAAARCLICQETRKRFEAQPVETCAWTRDEDDIEGESWRSSCGERWVFNDGGPIENRVKFCHGCGEPVVVCPSKDKEP